MNPNHHQLQWYLHPQAELLRLVMPFTHCCKASRQGQAPSPISSVVWQEPAARDICQTCTLPSGWPHCHGFSSSDLEGPHVSRYLHREVVGVLCHGWHLSWVAFLSEGTLSSSGGWSCTPPFNADKTPRTLPFHLSTLWYISTKWDLTDFLTPGLRCWVQWNQ